jgi:3-hydroxybutyryl-CoA dehydrogenase
MKLAIIANEPLKEEFLSKQILNHANVCFVKEPPDIPADTYIVFDLLFENNEERVSLLKQFFPRLVFINAVNETLAGIDQPFIRINAWPTFLQRNITELVVLPQQEKLLQQVFEYLGWRYQLVPDIIGMVSPRIAAMIINEAYFTLDEKISSKKEIDIAMKWGTHYPYGPFEWGKQIGLKRIYDLLIRLGKENKLYEVSTLLAREAIAQ